MALFKRKTEKKGAPKKVVSKEEKKTASPKKELRQFNSKAVRKPWVTEKSAGLGSLNKYVFVVTQSASSEEIKRAVEGIYNVTVTAVNIINVGGKQRRLGRSLGRKSGYRKAVVTIKEGQTIEVIAH